jgi:hypothetical protein
MNEIRVWIIGEIILNGKTVVLREKQDPTPFFFAGDLAILRMVVLLIRV